MQQSLSLVTLFGNRVGVPHRPSWAFALQCVATSITGFIVCLEQIRCSLLNVYGLAWSYPTTYDVSLGSKEPIDEERLFRIYFRPIFIG